MKIFIIGSCVTRDAFGFPGGDNYEIDAYIARTSLGVALTKEPFHGVILDSIKSQFQRNIVEIDLNKKLRDILVSSNSDCYIYDPIDERFDILVSENGASCTISNEFLSSGFLINSNNNKRIFSGDENFYLLWEIGWSDLVEIFKEKGVLEKLYINKVYWSEIKDDGTEFPNSIRRANNFLDKLYLRMANDIRHENFFQYPRSIFIGAVNHKWGVSPFHYVNEFYDLTLKNLKVVECK